MESGKCGLNSVPSFLTLPGLLLSLSQMQCQEAGVETEAGSKTCRDSELPCPAFNTLALAPPHLMEKQSEKVLPEP